MSVSIEGSYLGNKKTRLVHGPSGSELLTDAPRDNGGQGSLFSPTDLVASALGSCMMTIMAIVAEREALDLTGMTVHVEKVMRSEPRRIGCLLVELHMPPGIAEEQRRKLERAAHTCPVEQSLHPEIEIRTQFLYE